MAVATFIERGISGVPPFSSIEAARCALEAKRTGKPENLYFRDGTLALARLEAHVGTLMGVEGKDVVLYNTGMSAVVDALEIAGPSRDTVTLYPEQFYSQIGRYVENVLRDQRGARVAMVDTGSPTSVSSAIRRMNPDIVFFETVTNGQDMPVLDTEELFAEVAALEKKPLIILDNTLATPTGLPLAKRIKDLPFPVIVVESGTKFYALNQDIFGIATTNNQDILAKLRGRRQMIGSLTPPSTVRTVEQVILPTKEEFDRRNKVIFRNTLALAKACAEVGEETGKFAVFHPNLPSHPNFKLAQRLFPDGASPVFYIQSMGFNDEDQYAMAQALWDNPTVRELCELGQSFGFPKTRIWFDPSYSAVRVSGGLETPEQMEILTTAFKEGLRKFQ
ncbi:MAG: PLP-dependent transferase [Candidatus Levybacteria bacterium]|nr:PLP-dependent transferase [Candidatus Levybacteria bacterium]